MKTTPITVTLNVRDPSDRAALNALLLTYDEAPADVEASITAEDLRQAGKEISKAATNIEKLVGPAQVMSRSEKARMAAHKRWEKEKANKKVKEKPEHRPFEGEKQESVDNYQEMQGWPDGRDIIEAALPPRRE